MRGTVICGLIFWVFCGCGPARERGPVEEIAGDDAGVASFGDDAGMEEDADIIRVDPTPQPEPEPAPPSGEDVVQAFRMLLQQHCNTAHDCRYGRAEFPTPEQEAEFVRLYGTYEGECMAIQYPTAFRDLLRAAVDEGRTTYDFDQAAACEEALRWDIAYCTGFWRDGYPECEDIFIGTLPHGDPCAIDMECTSQVCGDDGTCR